MQLSTLTRHVYHYWYILIQEENACAHSVLKKASSEDFTPCSSGSREKTQEISEKMKHLLDSAEVNI